jgi:amino acid transporter
VYASRAIGPYAGFLASFSQWFGLCIAIGVVSYVIPPFLRDIAAAAQWTTVAAALDQRPLRLVLALAFLWTFVFVNLRGVRAVANTLLPLMLIMFVCGGLVIVTGFSHSPAEYLELLASQQRALPPEPARASFWLVAVPLAWWFGVGLGWGPVGLIAGICAGMVASAGTLVPRFVLVSGRPPKRL